MGVAGVPETHRGRPVLSSRKGKGAILRVCSPLQAAVGKVRSFAVKGGFHPGRAVPGRPSLRSGAPLGRRQSERRPAPRPGKVASCRLCCFASCSAAARCGPSPRMCRLSRLPSPACFWPPILAAPHPCGVPGGESMPPVKEEGSARSASGPAPQLPLPRPQPR
jgi:hypothetical protein